jgi:dienelactone hydrolase
MRDDRADWPDGLVFSTNRSPRWTTSLDGFIFGLQSAPPEKKPATLEDDDKPSLRLWHKADPRLQSQQQVQEASDRNLSYLAAYWPGSDRLIQLTDSTTTSASTVGDDRWVLATDVSRYQWQASVDGINRSDVYLVDPRTGQKRTFGTGLRSGVNVSPDGRWGAWFDNGEWHLKDLASGSSRQVTTGERFVNTEDDHNVEKPARPFFGWAADGNAFLLSDGWDIWRVNTAGGEPVNLTGDGKAKGIRYQRPMVLDFRARGHDLAKPLIISAREERTKREATFQLDPRTGRMSTMFAWRDARVAPMKARSADVWIAAISSADRFPDFWLMGARGDTVRLSDASPNMQGLAWSSGVRLVTYVSDKGDTLQGALHLPANYEPGKSYPTIVYIYEKMSDGLHTFSNPTFSSSYTPSIYTSRGYAVYQPDITYKLNDPGMSAVWALLPAMRAAAATGIVDSTRVGLHGHSWGGYQTAFMVTQTPYFRAAVAGAPLTDMISMYSSVYWNSGSANQPIFQSSQGRFLGNFIENRDAYERNSPNRFADRITTPLIILHNDKDGAVDYNQGITFFNTLRQLGKDVILLEYTGENHGLSQLKNRRDYTIRLMEFWDHHLKGEPAPAWLERGVPRLELEDHLRERRALYKPAAPEKKEPEKKEESTPPAPGSRN